MHIFMLDLDISQYPTMHEVINSMEDFNHVFYLCDTKENKDENELYITFLNISDGLQHTDSGPQRNNNQMFMPICNLQRLNMVIK